MGVGVRIKQVGPIKANVYGVGLYGSKGAIIDKMRAAKCNGARDVLELMSKGALFTDGAVVLKLARAVKADTMAGALADAIQPRMKGADSSSVIKKLRSILVAALPGGCAKNAELKFSCNTGSVGITVNGKFQGTIESSALSKAFLFTYCDGQGVSPSLRSDVASTVYSWTK